MKLAKNNIIVKLNDSLTHEYAIFNPITGSFDLMSPQEKTWLDQVQNEALDPLFLDYLIERGYAYQDKMLEEQAVAKAYQTFQQEIAATPVQLMLVPTYGCNLSCTYCFQHGIEENKNLITTEIVDAFFAYARENFSGTSIKPFITLFGGEPLSNSQNQHEIMNYIIEQCVIADYELAVVTNGYDLTHYIPDLKKARIKEIQITLDGSKDVHDARRGTANQKGTFDAILAGMTAAIEAEFPINLRSVVDLENIADLVKLAEILDSHGWLDLPGDKFKTQLGRNYELFECYAKPQHLMSQIELWAAYTELCTSNPILKKFHQPDLKGSRYLAQTGDMYMASFDTCPACKTEWVFDLYGKIYSCTASCGRQEYLLGTYWPTIERNETAIATWQKRDVTAISQCRDCRYDVICGGGCGVVAANKNQGNILSPDCRPIQDMLELGINYYLEDIMKHSQLEEQSSTPPLPGCMICREPLIYKEETTTILCQQCGTTQQTRITCPNGHYICDDCHAGSILPSLEKILVASTESHPVKLAMTLFELPGLEMHGPEYHSLVPGVIVAAWQNLSGTKNPTAIMEAIRRGQQIKGGSCGYNGSCGAGIGAGIAASVINNATPLSCESRSQANQTTARALLEISKVEASRCCKREAITAITSFMANHDTFADLNNDSTTRYVCVQYKNNQDCAGKNCPYHPKSKINQ